MKEHHYTLPKSSLLRWLLAPEFNVPDEVQNNLIAPFFASILPAVLGTTSVLIFNLVGFIRHPDLTFGLLLFCDVALALVRLPFLAAGKRLAGQGRPTPTGLVTTCGLLWCALIGLSNLACFTTQDPALWVLSIANMLGVIGGLVARNHVCPRFAILQILLCDGPYNLVLPFCHEQIFFILLASTPLYLVGMTGAVLKLHRSYLAVLMSEYENKQRASFDLLTGLRNRHGLFSVLADQLQSIDEIGHLALLYLDLDGFKAINDTFGHAAGDDLLRQVAERLVAIVPKDSIIARLGGDEFVVVANEYTSADAIGLGEAIVASVKRPFDLGVVDGATVGISIGIALTTNVLTPDALMAAADRALYRAKAGGKGRVVMAEGLVPLVQSVA